MKKSAKIFSSLAAGLLLVIVSGCIGFSSKPYVEVKYYDLATPPQIVLKKAHVKILPFESTEPAKYKMVYRGKNCELIMDDYNKWVQPPSMMLTRYLQSAFKQTGISTENSELTVSGNLFMFRIDLQKNTASLGISYVIKCAPNDVIKPVCRNSTVFSCKFKKQGPEYFVQALSECARQMVLTIERDINKIHIHKQNQKKKDVTAP